jgi:hypothetical protein
MATRTRSLSVLVCVLGLTACGDDARPGTDAGDGRPDAGPGRDAGGPADAGPGPDPVDGGGGTDAGPMPTEEVRFVAIGDQGEGNEAQRAVAVAIRDHCAAHGCDFVVLLGDNFYDSGVESVDDAQWNMKFEEPYRDIDLPFYAVLGNHDYGGDLFGIETGGLGNEFMRGPIEVAYTERSDKWEMPATYYTVRRGSVGLIMLDTNSILWANTTNGDQKAWWETAMTEVAGAEWVIVFGHHPYRSNGRHGNAGSYESIEVGGVELPNPFPIMNGEEVRLYFNDYVCGAADVYISGHDHNRQWINEPDALCGAELIVTGAGAKTTAFESTLNETFFQDDTTEGFLYVVVDGPTLTGQFIDRNGMVNFERTVVH